MSPKPKKATTPKLINTPKRDTPFDRHVMCDVCNTWLSPIYELLPGMWRCPGGHWANGCVGGQTFYAVRDA